MKVTSFLQKIFVDPLTARFMLFYLPALLLLIAIAVIHERRASRGAPRPARLGGSWLTGRVVAFGNAIADWLAASDITPNQITCIGLVLGLTNCALYLYHRNGFWLGMGLAMCFPFDSLDGLVARLQKRITKFGAYLDAEVDRYHEIAACLVIAIVTGWWMVMFFVITGGMLVSYNKARAAIEIPVDNKGWHDLMIQHRRLFVLCVGLAADVCVPGILYVVLVFLAAASHFTALQRFLRARRMLGAADAAA
jgi:phosphatidylglycerophosphate synthase